MSYSNQPVDRWAAAPGAQGYQTLRVCRVGPAGMSGRTCGCVGSDLRLRREGPAAYTGIPCRRSEPVCPGPHIRELTPLSSWRYPERFEAVDLRDLDILQHQIKRLRLCTSYRLHFSARSVLRCRLLPHLPFELGLIPGDVVALAARGPSWVSLSTSPYSTTISARRATISRNSSRTSLKASTTSGQKCLPRSSRISVSVSPTVHALLYTRGVVRAS